MTDLQIAITAHNIARPLRRGAIVTVTKLADLEGRRTRNATRQTATVDIVNENDLAYTNFELPDAGIYEVSVRHPGGLETKEVDVPETSSVVVPTFPSSDLTPLRRIKARLDRQSNGNWIGLNSPVVSGNRSVFAFLRTTAAGMAEPNFENFRRTSLIRPGSVVGRFIRGDSLQLQALDFHEMDAVFSLLRDTKPQTEPADRWLALLQPEGRDLVSVPWGWQPDPFDEQRDVKLSIENGYRRDRGINLARMTVDDTVWNALLDYVTLGRMADASVVARGISDNDPQMQWEPSASLPERALQGKVQDPMVATLGGIVLVSTAESAEAQRWDAWLRNLANWFPGIPDSAAIYGYRLLQLGEREVAHEWLIKSVQAGLPFFSATFRLLSLAFAQLGDREYGRRISPAATAVDPTQPFTVIHVPWDKGQ
ncbi:hypothetical protein [Rhizobium leguminosarum]|uniref:hypothetical protein n=1 Tax=Rhizobium leguminosarum TaxID=384 RepID=UPI0004899FA2|nr:hypothetical protein [Rhizobium leguminosarum]